MNEAQDTPRLPNGLEPLDELIRQQLSKQQRLSLFERIFKIRIIKQSDELVDLLYRNASEISDALEMKRKYIDYEMITRDMIDYEKTTRDAQDVPSPDEGVWKTYNKLRKKRRRLYTEFTDCVQRILNVSYRS